MRTREEERLERERALRDSGQAEFDGPTAQILQLQQSLGNAAVTRLVQRAPRERPASTDVDDVAGSENGHKEAHDLHARIIQVSVVSDHTRIGIASGSDQGVHEGMEGYALDEAGAVHPFTIEEVRPRVCFAKIGMIVSAAEAADKVVINPASMPQSAAAGKDVHARIVGVSIEGGLTKITIASGPQQGIQVGMKGSLVGPNGKEYKDFEIADAEGRVSHAYVEATPDEVRAHDHVVVHASGLAQPPVRDQQF